jgi:hypothetical protein
VWKGVSNPHDKGFHYYQLNVGGVSIPDTGSVMFYGSSRWDGSVEVRGSLRSQRPADFGGRKGNLRRTAVVEYGLGHKGGAHDRTGHKKNRRCSWCHCLRSPAHDELYCFASECASPYTGVATRYYN